jgi:lipid-binding SYLF domain-containing protein
LFLFVSENHFRYIDAVFPGFHQTPPGAFMNKPLALVITLSLLLSAGQAHAWKPDDSDKLELAVAQAILKAKDKDPALEKWFESAYAYAVFPRVGKAGIGIGGAHGKGLVIHGDQTVGKSTLTQVSIGLQLGGQVYAEYIMFRDETAFNDFTRGNYELGAQVSAVAVNLGASADADYNSGVAIFTIAEGGLMYEASIGGQKFKYHAK